MHAVNAGDLIATGTPAGCAVRSPGKAHSVGAQHLVSDATQMALVHQQSAVEPGLPAAWRPDQASIRTDDGAIDLGEQTTRIVAA